MNMSTHWPLRIELDYSKLKQISQNFFELFGKDEEEHNSSGRATCKGRQKVEDEHEKLRIAKCDAH